MTHILAVKQKRKKDPVILFVRLVMNTGQKKQSKKLNRIFIVSEWIVK